MLYYDYKLFVQNMTRKYLILTGANGREIDIYILPIIIITRYLTRVLPRVKYIFSQQKNFYIGFFDMFLQLKKF
jgi:hypothetical protein